MEAVLSAKSLSKAYVLKGGKIKNMLGLKPDREHLRYAVKDLNLEVYPGEILGLLGPNGAGKTTAIKMFTGLIEPSEGEVYICGKNIVKEREKALENIGAVIENPDMFLKLSAYENLHYFAKLQGGVSEEDINEALKTVEIEDRAREEMKKYSLGMKQRIGIAQAIMHKPKLLILDEPTNGLDPQGIAHIRGLLKNFAAKNMAIIVSSHILSEMEMLCTKVAIIDKGKLLCVKKVEDLGISENNEALIEMIVDDKEKALKILNDKFRVEGKTAGDKIIINASKEKLPEITSHYGRS